MKYHILILSLFFNINVLFSQSTSEIEKTVNTYEKAIDAGKKAMETKEFDKAINYFFAAEAYQPDKRKEVKDLIDEVFDEIQALKKEAEDALLEAERQKDKAIKSENRAVEAQKETAKALKEAEEERVKADTAAAVALREKIKADTATAIAERAKIKADTETIKAIKATIQVQEEKKQTKLLRVEALSTSTALKSISMDTDYEDTLKALLAVKAFNMQKTMLEDTTKKDKTWLAPEIYTALHDAMITVKGEHYDELTKEDGGHFGPVRSIFQVDEKRIYTSGSDGKIILWEIDKWNTNGKPTLSKVVPVRQEKKIITASAIMINEKESKELVAIGGQFSAVELIKNKGTEIKKSNFEKAPKNKNLTYQTLHQNKIENVYDIKTKENLIYILGKDSTIKVYNTETDKSKTLITLKRKAEHIAIHPDGQIIAIGYKKGGIDLFDINDFAKPLSKLDFKRKELKGKPITAMTFSKNELAFGTNDGYIGILSISKENNHHVDSIRFRKVHSFVVSTIDFKTFINKKGKEFVVMAVGDYDGMVSVWLLKEFQNKKYEPFLFDDKGTFVTSLAFVDNSTNPKHNQLYSRIF